MVDTEPLRAPCAEALGAWSLKARPNATGVQFNNLSLELKGLQLTGNAGWPRKLLCLLAAAALAIAWSLAGLAPTVDARDAAAAIRIQPKVVDLGRMLRDTDNLIRRSLGEAIERQHESVRGLIRLARNLTVVSWFFYPVVYFLPFVISMNGGTATAVIELGYTIADITAKAVFGLVIYAIAVRKSEAEGHKA